MKNVVASGNTVTQIDEHMDFKTGIVKKRDERLITAENIESLSINSKTLALEDV
jgi:hypothetical protein